MAILKAYLDDSGNPNDPQHSVLTVAGYLSTADGWSWFETHWPKVMEKHGVPYLHMRELWDRNGDFGHLKDSDGTKADFLADCISVIQTGTEFAPSASIRLADLEAFNKESKLGLDPMALAIYGCLIELRNAYPKDEIEVFLDNISKPYKRIETALNYARSDTWQDLKPNTLLLSALPDGGSFKTILPIQAADFSAWEIRKNCEERKTWNPAEEDRRHAGLLNASYLRWTIEFFQKFGRMPRQRMSAKMLSAWPPPQGYLWDYANIKGAHVNRHKNGWGA